MTRLACFLHYRYTARYAAAHLTATAGLLLLGHRLTHGGTR